MANLVPSGVDLISGQTKFLTSQDQLTDSAGNSFLQDCVQVISTFPNIDTTVPGSTPIYVVPSGKTVYVTELLISVTSSTDITSPARVSLGAITNSDIIPETTLTNLIAANRFYSLDVSALAEAATSTDQIVFTVVTEATGTGSPAQLVTLYMIGIEL